MFYDRPRKRKKPEEVLKREEEAREKRIEEKRREEKNTLFSFFFETPVHTPKGYEENQEADHEGESAPARKKKHILPKFCAMLVFLALLAGAGLYFLPVGLFGASDEQAYMADNDLPGGYVHVLLVGLDKDSTGTSRSDTMIVASVSRGEVKLTSLLRDTGVTIPGKSGTHRLNAAYAYGGIDLLLKTVNFNFGLNITRYAMVDYDSFPVIIDQLGGVKLAVTDEEVEQINNNVRGLLYMSVKAGEMEYNAGYRKYLDEILNESGDNVHLDGLQTLGYARIRNIDSDYGRTNRQRKVLSAVLTQAKSHPLRLIGAASKALELVETNMNTAEILSIGLKAITGGVPEQTRLPASGTYTDNGGMFENVDFGMNRSYFMDFVYE